MGRKDIMKLKRKLLRSFSEWRHLGAEWSLPFEAEEFCFVFFFLFSDFCMIFYYIFLDGASIQWQVQAGFFAAGYGEDKRAKTSGKWRGIAA